MIRAITASDGDWLTRMLGDFFNELSLHAPGLFAPEAASIYAELYLSESEDRFGRVFFDEEARAILLARGLRRPARLPGSVLIMDVAFTEGDFRGRGLMEGLLADAKAWCAGRAIPAMELGTPAVGPARDYWTRRGFRAEFVTMSRDSVD